MGEASGAAVLLDVPTGGLVAIHAADVAGRFLAPPGSTLKPFVLTALLKTGKLAPDFAFPCPGRLIIAGRSFTCSHPALNAPLHIDMALAYSCNCFVAHAAGRFATGELARALSAAGLASRTGMFGDAEIAGRVQPAGTPDSIRLQSLGEGDVLVTTAGLAMACRHMALAAQEPPLAPIFAGLEGAVEFGTARAAKVEDGHVAGKTGSVRTPDGTRIAWFAGFMPSHDPRVALAVMVQGRSGGADAAPIAQRIFSACRTGRI
jgi:cell division protein FtsI/penicillin-binding protein 2